jgi:two-component system, NtrC family, sensor kinase
MTELYEHSDSSSVATAEEPKTTLGIILLEDDSSCRTLLKSHLTKKLAGKYDLTIWENSLLEDFLKNEHVAYCDVLLLDLNLPDSSGLGTLKRISSEYPNIPIVVTTGNTDESLGVESMSCGAQEYLIKGEYTSSTLCKAVFHAIERKRLHDAQELAIEQLNSTIKQLKDAQAQVLQSEKLASIGQLAAGVAHEMNTPVGFVASNFETLGGYLKKIRKLLEQYEQFAKNITAESNPVITEGLNQIQTLRKDLKIDFILEDIIALFEESKEGLNRVTTIIRNLRDFSHVDQLSEFAEYDLNQCLKSTLVVSQNELKYNCNIETDFGDIPKIECNSGQLNQVFLNILLNAAQAIGSQERTGNGHIKIKTFEQNEWVCCQIADDGPGIPKDIIDKIFDPFFTTKPVGKGTGLGLSVSYDIIVTKHKGKLEVESIVGTGTTFNIKLPKIQRVESNEKNLI